MSEQRLIDIKKFKAKIRYAAKTYGLSDVIKDKILDAIDASVVTAKWIWLSDDDVICSACQKTQNTHDNCDAGIWDHCPHCGAKMEK